MLWYVQCVGRKYEGILGSGEPRRSSRTKRDMLSSGVRKVDSGGWNVSSHSWASDLQGKKQSVLEKCLIPPIHQVHAPRSVQRVRSGPLLEGLLPV